MDIKSRTCCFTGHRAVPILKSISIKRRLKLEVIKLIEQGFVFFGVGGALGFDTLVARCILQLKESHPQIKLILVLPCKNQTEKWSMADSEVYEDIKKSADKVVYTEENYTNDCMHKRNRHLVDNSAHCICYQTVETGGTAYTTRYAKKQGLMIVNLAV